MTNEVAIIGGGCAGLACAIRLKERNIPFKLFEASTELGGRVSSEVTGDFMIDKGFQVLLPHYKTAKKLLDYKALDLCKYPKGASILTPNGTQWFGLQLPPHLKTGEKLKPTYRDYMQLGLDVMCGAFPPKKPSGATVDHFLANYSTHFANQFLIPFFRGVFLDPNCEKSPNQFQYYLHAFLRGGAAIPAKGMATIPLQLASQLPDHSIEYKSTVTAIHNNTVTVNANVHSFKHIVLATDLSNVHRLLNQPLPKTPWLGVHNVMFSKKGETQLAPLTLVARPSIISHINVPTLVSTSLGPNGTHVVNVSLFDHHDPADVQREFVALTNESDWEFLGVNAIPNALPKYQLTPTVTPNVSICGDWMSTIQSIEGALHSGYNVPLPF